jgi:GT2 family glycosyltransferase
LGASVLELSPGRPFSAARARNEGLGDALRRWPGLQYVIFLDADCVLDCEFPAAAAAKLASTPGCAIVTGHLSERSPDASPYNRLCAIEWQTPAGRIENFAALGGIMAADINVIQHMGGFNEQVIAGEDSELGVRLALAGYSVFKIDSPMAIHDAEMCRFGQWWKRAVRSGHALAQRYALNGSSRLHDCRKEFFSALWWGLAVPIATIGLIWPTRGLSLLLLGGYVLLALRVYRHYRKRGQPKGNALLAARYMIYTKFAQTLGMARYWLNRARGSFRIIEYK